MAKPYREQLLDVLEKDIFETERKLKDVMDHLDELKDRRNEVLEDLASEQDALKTSTFYYLKGYDGFEGL